MKAISFRLRVNKEELWISANRGVTWHRVLPDDSNLNDFYSENIIQLAEELKA